MVVEKTKLAIRDVYFRQIASGKKEVDYRDAHITFENEKTGKKLTRKVVGVSMIEKQNLPRSLQKDMFTDETQIKFYLEPMDVKKNGRKI